MADTISSSYKLSLVAEFTDGDDRTLSVKNPRSNITWAELHNIAEKAANVLIGDRAGAAFQRFKTAELVQTDIHKLDLS